jgi:hypothetical protein
MPLARCCDTKARLSGPPFISLMRYGGNTDLLNTATTVANLLPATAKRAPWTHFF